MLEQDALQERTVRLDNVTLSLEYAPTLPPVLLLMLVPALSVSTALATVSIFPDKGISVLSNIVMLQNNSTGGQLLEFAQQAMLVTTTLATLPRAHATEQ